jgi:hypothetical protein
MRGRGNSYAMGPRRPRTWHGGYQAPEPVTLYTLAEGDRYV